MGRSTNALLVYGYDLGGGDGDWQVQETRSFGLLDVPWWDQEDDDPSFLEAAQSRLREAGVTGVEVHTHTSQDYPAYLLTVHCTTAYRGTPKRLDFDDLTRSQLAGDWDDQLDAAMKALGLTSTQDSPGWLLASYAEL
jgi:hypothetical protein